MAKKNIIVLVVSVIILTGCYTEKKAFRQLDKAYNTYPATTAIRCDTWFPIKWFDSTRIEYIFGDVEYIHDTIVIDCDTVKAANDGTKIVKAPCPPCPQRVDTVITYREKQGESTAALEVERLKTESAKEEVNKLRERISVMRVYLLITGVLALYTVVRWVVRFWGVKLP